MGSRNDENTPINIRKPQIKDGNRIFHLVKECKPLDINSLYYYLLICAHFDQTSVITELDSEIIGYISAYINPHQKNTLFIWQVAVHPDMRGQGLAIKMMKDILEREEIKSVEFIETTVTPSNQASMSLFGKIASKLDTNLQKSSFFTSDLFGESNHEEELLLRIGPLTK
ncbi:diaminobutyrate acetyltransferase [Methanobacterium petrolearium]|uniref:diaminobutyrate acetyltransferase n=1 Tax=Methanobacterium petrolearium TaxID=710190 RepID=UPI001AE9450B|nr:diaminobutyrate acetyltransferase [Methanobacterium petrolearium]MBP1946545.1 L-2,4-diaminobutyric acid acetyltransferase [Methanobacterium petrolearium]